MTENSALLHQIIWPSLAISKRALFTDAAENALIDDDTLIAQLLPEASLANRYYPEAKALATQLLQTITTDSGSKNSADASNLTLDQFFQQYQLSTQEGLALMSLAEALLRIPNRRTAERLIRDKLSSGNWGSYLGRSDSTLVNASTWGLLLSGKFLSAGLKPDSSVTKALGTKLRQLGEPVIYTILTSALEMMGKRYVMAQTIESALDKSTARQLCSFDMLGESARTANAANDYFKRYQHALESIAAAKVKNLDSNFSSPHAKHGLSIKLSALHPRFEISQYDKVFCELLPKLTSLAELAKRYDLALTIDAETCACLEISLKLFEKLLGNPNLTGWQGLGIAVQAYQKRAPKVIDYLIALAKANNTHISIRLVKGAYWDTDIKWAQQQGLSDYPVFSQKKHTDTCYLACAQKLLHASQWVYPQFASHNALTLASIIKMADALNIDASLFEFQRLHGMGKSLHDAIISGTQKYTSRLYAPVGERKTLLAYLVRRMLENGANSSFVQQQQNPSMNIDSLLENPLQQSDPESHKKLVKPEQLFQPTRENSIGNNLWLQAERDKWQEKIQGTPIFSGAEHNAPPENPNTWQVRSPFNKHPSNEVMPLCYLQRHNKDDLATALKTCSTTTLENDHWSNNSQVRIEALNKLAYLLEAQALEIATLCLHECGKTLADSLDELREAVDFCRYYAAQVQKISEQSESMLPKPLGLVACISPWNFPVAIFIGQLTSALACGNRVLVKPASSTSLTASLLLDLIRRSGIGPSILQFTLCSGRDFSKQVLSNPLIDGVLFTGSLDSANSIWRQLLETRTNNTENNEVDKNSTNHSYPVKNSPEINNHYPVFIAETGGQNAMIVDASALLEQAVTDVIRSAFNSAGQRCSALRVLYLQEDIAEEFITMLTGAMAELNISHPDNMSTDIGPVIDEAALKKLQSHCEYLERLPSEQCQLLYRCSLNSAVQQNKSGHYFAPALYEIETQSLLANETFGPVLHLIRFHENELPQVLDAINHSGYGLTLGIQSRVTSTQQYIIKRARVGNIYINRNQVGAVVGCQPFGGINNSGTGPKSGGPNALSKLWRQPSSAISIIDMAQNNTTTSALENDSVETVQGNFKQQLIQLNTDQINNCAASPATERLQALDTWLLAMEADIQSLARDKLAGTKLIHNCRKLQAQANALLSHTTLLPGCTGELNLLRYLARGTVVVICRDTLLISEWLQQTLAALVAGNSVLLLCETKVKPIIDTGLQRFKKAGFAESSFACVVLPSTSTAIDFLENHWSCQDSNTAVDSPFNFAALVDHPNSSESLALAKLLTQKIGPIRPILAPAFDDNYLVNFCLEQVISEDTSASGANVGLFNQVHQANTKK